MRYTSIVSELWMSGMKERSDVITIIMYQVKKRDESWTESGKKRRRVERIEDNEAKSSLGREKTCQNPKEERIKTQAPIRKAKM